MPKKEEEGVNTLMSLMPWLKREEAMELLKNNGGDVERVKRVLEKADTTIEKVQPSQKAKGNKATDAENKAEKYFVGGGPSSGQVVLGGVDRVDNVINSLFEKARQQSDENDVDEVQAFFGRGRRLGHTTAESPFMKSEVQQRRDVVITVYRNGFSIDNGPRRDKESAEGMAFFRALETGHVPDIIANMYPNTSITARLVDCSQHDAPPNFLPFTGEGHRLTDPSSNSATNPSPPAREEGSASYPNNQGTFELYEGEETAKLAIVNFFGERREFTVNPNRHTVGDLFILASQHAQLGALSFQLIARDVPPRPLTNRSLTVDEAKLRNATLMMRKL